MTHAKYKSPATLSDYVFGKTPPQSLELEEAVLGAVMIDRDALPGILDILKPESFYTAAHQEIYRACVKLYGKGEPVDILTVTEQLRRHGQLDTAGGAVYLVELTNRVASSANLEYHARIVAQKALQRDLIQAANESIRAAYDETTDAFDLLHESQKRLFDLANFGGRMAESVGQISMRVIKQLEFAMQAKDGITGIPSGLLAVDKTTGGWQNSDLIVLAARPGMGKTAFVLCAALNAARQGYPVALFSLEMSKPQLVQRLLSMETGISISAIRQGKVTTDDARRIFEASERIQDLPLYIDDTPGMNIFELRAKAWRLKMQHGIMLVIIDYLQMMGGEQNRNSNREQEISGISRGCKNLAKDLDVPVIALSQLSRAVELRANKRPQLSDLRESGAIEQDADMVAFIYREDYYLDNPEMETDEAELLIKKHRNGALNDIGLHFDGPTTKFTDISRSNQFPAHAIPQAIPAGAGRSEDVPF